MIVCNDLHKGFGDVKAVDGISFQVPDGTFLGLLGPNGAGKTTLMRMMTGLLAPDTGTVEFDNRLMDRNAIGVKQVIGVTSQHVNLDKELTVEENMEFAGRLPAGSHPPPRRSSQTPARSHLPHTRTGYPLPGYQWKG